MLMHKVFALGDAVRVYAFSQIMRRGTPAQLLALVQNYYGPMFKAMGYDVDIQIAPPGVGTEASSKEDMLRMLGDERGQ